MSYFSTRTAWQTLLVLVSSLLLALCLALAFGQAYEAYANSVSINDQAGVLNANKVQAEAAKLSDAVAVYTTRTFHGDQDALNNDASGRVNSSNMIVIEIDTVHRHLSIQNGTQSKLTDGEASEAVDAFRNNFNNGDYTGATIAAIDSLQNSLSGSNSTSGITVLGIVVAVVLGIAALVLLVIGISRRQRRNGPPGGGRGWSNRGYGPGYYPYPGYVNPANNPGNVPSTGGGGAGGSFGGGGFGGGFGGGGGGGAGGSF